MFVPFILGSKIDEPHAAKITAILDQFEIPYKIYVASAHKVPEKVLEVIKEYDAKDGPICYITIAGRSNALSGFVSANSIYPVIACPPFSDKADMMVNIHSTLQMPSETPALTVIDPKNAAQAAIRILAADNAELRQKVHAHLAAVKNSF
jgi:5-(carboxyamino)imidazole ribonucleotide mutase